MYSEKPESIKCELCDKDATYLSYSKKRGWIFVCTECDYDLVSYDINLERLLQGTGDRSWLDHLADKNWFPETAEQFIEKFLKYRYRGIDAWLNTKTNYTN